MFCPQCSQQQTSEKIKFCSRCGFELDLVSEILSNGGNLPQLNELSKSNEKLTKRMNIFFGLSVWLVVSFLFNLISVIVSKSADGLIVATVGLLLGLFIMIISAPFLKSLSRTSKNGGKSLFPEALPKNLRANDSQPVLPSAESSIQDFIAPVKNWKVNTTNELIQPLSVTDATTKFLKKD